MNNKHIEFRCAHRRDRFFFKQEKEIEGIHKIKLHKQIVHINYYVLWLV